MNKEEKELIDELTELHDSGRVDRRTFMGLLAASGITLASVKAIEEEIYKQPEYWLWSHKRFKHKKPAGIELITK